jgi:hypothetical protein
MAETPASLNDMSRRDLSELARNLGIADAEVMTRAELRAAIERSQSLPRAAQPPWPTTWLGVARGLIASIVEQGLNLPDAAALIRGDTKLSSPPKPAPPVATVTLARIYAAQGHVQRAIDTLDEVLESDPDHELARQLRDEFAARKVRGAASAQRASSAAADAASPPSADPATEPSLAASPAAPLPSADPVAPAPVESVVHDAAAPASEPPPTIDERLPVTSAASPEPPPAARVEPLPASPAPAPEPAPAPSSRWARSSPTPREAPRPVAAELVLIQTDAPAAYVYWELSPTAPQPVTPEQCSLLLVAHTPRPAGAERIERRLSLSASSGALRLTGLPERAVLRALLTREAASHAQNGAAAPKPLAVAGAVRAQEPPREPAIQVLFCPSRRHNPADVAVRAIDHLANATSVAW